MVVSLVGPVRYGVIYLNGESCSGRSLGSCPKRRKRAWLCGEGDFRQTERELSPSFKLYSWTPENFLSRMLGKMPEIAVKTQKAKSMPLS